MNIVVGLFDHPNANRSIEVLENYGIDHGHISIIARHRNNRHGVQSEGVPRTTAASGAFAGTLCGFRAFTFAAPEIGPLIAAGALARTLFSMLETRATSSLLAALVNSGFSETDAELYVDGVKRGDILISVETMPLQQRSTASDTAGLVKIEYEKFTRLDISVIDQDELQESMALESV